MKILKHKTILGFLNFEIALNKFKLLETIKQLLISHVVRIHKTNYIN